MFLKNAGMNRAATIPSTTSINDIGCQVARRLL